MLDAGRSLCSLLKIVFLTFPLDSTSTPSEVKILYQKVQDLIEKQIAVVTAPQTSGEDTVANSISFVLLVIKTLMEVQKNLIDPSLLVRILQRLARDLGSLAGTQARQVSFLFYALMSPGTMSFSVASYYFLMINLMCSLLLYSSLCYFYCITGSET